jgi:hypothetical protein
LLLVAVVLIASLGWLLLRVPSAATSAAPPLAAPSPTHRVAPSAPAADRAQLEPRSLVEPAAALPAPAPSTTSQSEVPAGSYIVSGSVRDERTGEPVPELDVALESNGVREVCTTDAAGLFSSTREFPAAAVQATLTDLGWSVGSAKLEHAALPFDIAVRIGPTYPVSITPLVPNGQLQVRLTERTCGPWAAILEVDKGGDLEIAKTDTHDWGPVLLRGDTQPWVRFPRAQEPRDEKWSAWLMLEDAYGQRWCEVAAPGTVGIRPSVRFSTDPGLGSIRGVVGQSSARWKPTRVCAVPLERRDDLACGWHHAKVGENGQFTLAGVRAGRWRVVAYANGLYADEAIVDVLPEGVALLQFRLAEPAIDVQVVRKDEERDALLWGASPTSLAPFHPPFVGVGALDDLPRLKMDVLAVQLDAAQERRDMRTLRTTWDGAGELELGTPPERVRLRFAFDAPGSARATEWFALGPGGTVDGVWPARRYVLVDPNEPLGWFAGARGCRPAFGTLQDGVRTDDELRIRVQLAPGWGVHLLAFERGFDSLVSLKVMTDLARGRDLDELSKRMKQGVADVVGPPIPFGVAALLDAPSTRARDNPLRVPSSGDANEPDWLRELAEYAGLGSVYYLGDGATHRLGVALDRTRYEVQELRPYLGGDEDRWQERSGMHRYQLACKRLAPVEPAKPPVHVDGR